MDRLTRVRFLRWWLWLIDHPSPLVKQGPTAVAIALACLIVWMVPELAADHPMMAAVGAGMVLAATVYAGVLGARGRHAGLAVLLIPMVDIVAIGIFRMGTGGPQSMFAALIILPVIWLAAAPGLRYVLAVVVLTAVSLTLPFIIEPPSLAVQWLRGVISPLVFAAVGVIVNELSRQQRVRAEQAERLVRERTVALERNEELMAEMRVSRARKRELLDNFQSLWASVTAQAIIACDRRGQIEAWNPGAERLFGWSAEEIDEEDLRVAGLFPAGTLEALLERPPTAPGPAARAGLRALLDLADGGPDAGADLQVVTRSETIIPARVTVSHRVGESPGWLLVITDESRAAELARLKDDFVGMVSHELRTPLSSIIGFLDLLRDDPEQPLTPEQRELTDIMDRNAQRLLDLVGDLLFTAQAESERFQLTRAEVDVRRIMEAAVASAGAAAAARGITLRSEVEPDPVILDVEERRIGQAVDNLLSNALKFTPEGGLVETRLERRGDEVVIAVRDTGYGIPAEEQRLLFTRFFRASTATRHAVPGVGLGLTITRAIVTAHGGRMELSSVEGEGTEFRIVLPDAGADEAGDSGAGSAESAPGGS